MLVSCLGTGPHITVNLDDDLNRALEGTLELQFALSNRGFRFPGDEQASMDLLLLEGGFPCRIRRRSSDNAWIAKASAREGQRCICKLASSEKTILKIVRNAELEGKCIRKTDTN